MKNNKYTKEYYECYALDCLNLFYDTGLSFKNNKHEHPDWLSEDKSFGIEVSRAEDQDSCENIAYINEYFGRGLSGQVVLDGLKKRNPLVGSRITVIDDVAVYSTITDVSNVLANIIERIHKKNNLLVDTENTINRLWLFLFATEAKLDIDDMKSITQEVKPENTVFEKIFICNLESLFVIDNETVEETIISDGQLKSLKQNAFVQSLLLNNKQ